MDNQPDLFAYETAGTITLYIHNVRNMERNHKRSTSNVTIGNVPFYVQAARELTGSTEFLATFLQISNWDEDMSLNWTVNVRFTFVLIANDGEDFRDTEQFTLVPGFSGRGLDLRKWADIEDPESKFVKDGAITIKTEIEIVSSDGFLKKRLLTVEKNPLTDACLLVNGEKMFVNRGLLATYSPYFYKLFYGEFADKDKDEIELKDVVCDEFSHFLKMFHSGEIDKKSVVYLMKLADMFDCQMVMDKCADFLRNAVGMELLDRLLLADKYRRFDVETQCMKEIKTAAQAKSLAKELVKCNDRLKITFFYKMRNL